MPGPGDVHIRPVDFGPTTTVLDDLADGAHEWESLTPFIPPRHRKKDWATFLETKAHRELAHRGLPPPASR